MKVLSPRRFACVSAALGLAALYAAPGAAAPSASPRAGVEVTARVDQASITIGDRVRYEIEVLHPPSGKVELPAVLGNLGAFEVKDYQTEQGKAQDGRARTVHAFVISTFTVGAYTLPPQRVEYRQGKDTAALVLYTQPTEIQVKRTSPETVKDIADLADLAETPGSVPWGAVALGAVALAALAFFLWRRHRKRNPAGRKEPPPLPPDEEARQRLRALNAVQLLRQNRAREFAFALSEILRNYVGRRYGIDALESTTPEFLDKVAPLPLTQAQKSWLKECCESLDQAKYATGGILESEADRRVRETLDFVEKTRPSVEVGQPAGSQA